jgi:hypothetical protein
MVIAFIERNAAFFDIYFITALVFLLLSGLSSALIGLFQGNKKNAAKSITNLLISICYGFVVLFAMIVVSLVLSLFSVPLEYGLYGALIIAPTVAILVNTAYIKQLWNIK